MTECDIYWGEMLQTFKTKTNDFFSLPVQYQFLSVELQDTAGKKVRLK